MNKFIHLAETEETPESTCVSVWKCNSVALKVSLYYIHWVVKPQKGARKLEPFTWRGHRRTQHQGLSVSAGFSKLNPPGTAGHALTGRDGSPGKANQTRITTGKAGESRVALDIETITFLPREVSALLPLFKLRMGRVEKEGQRLALPSPPLPSLAEVPDTPAGHPAPR